MIPTRPRTFAHESEVERLYREESGRLWRSLVAATGSRDLADDVVAETFTLALEAWGSIRDPSGWLWRVAFRVLWRELRRQRQERLTMPERHSHQSPPDPAILLALQELPYKQRATMVLHYYADMRIHDIATTMGLTSPAVRVNLMRGRRRLKDILEESDE